MKKAVLIMLLFAGAASAQAEVYKWVDEQGNVHFSDEPTDPNAEKVYIPPPSTYTPAPLPKFQPQKPGQPALDENYDALNITSPTNDEVLWDKGGEVMVSVGLQPALNLELGHKLEFSLDGRKVGESNTGSFLITNIERGTHRITARVVNAAGVALDSDSVTIHMRQRTVTDAPANNGGATPSIPRAPTAPQAPQAPRL